MSATTGTPPATRGRPWSTPPPGRRWRGCRAPGSTWAGWSSTRAGSGAGAAGADLPPAGGRPEAAGGPPARAARRPVRAVGQDRGHPGRRPGRRRRGHRGPVHLRQQGPARAAQRRPLPRRAPGAAGPGRDLFPVWGMLEKLAPAVLAGVPAIVKPASQTAYVTELAFRHLVESGALPAGSVQLLCGAVGDLLDHLTGQDTIAFTGSAATARRLRGHPTVIGESVRFNAEADSLNCSILGPDAAPGSEEFDLFVGEVVRELTQKTGQKCTAIRRSLVPATHAGAVVDALAERLAEVRVGDPRDPATTMGPLVSRGQLAEVGRAVVQLGRAAEVALGGPDRLQLASGDPERGAFCAPTVLLAEAAEAPELHSVEAFGPVTSVIGYRDAGHAVAPAALGRGSLVGSVVTHDPDFARRVVTGVAPWHGRLLVLDRDDAGESTGHGAPLPHLVHGGPGRAGGGEELGGIRAVLHHMQVTSVSASPAMVTAVTGRFTPGAPTTTGPVYPFRRHFEDLAVGETLHTAARTVTLEDIERFADLSGDRFYAHMDEAAAKANPFFDGRVAHGYFVVSAAAGLFVDPDPGPCLANYGLERLRFLRPVYPGDTLTVDLTCKQKSARDGEDYGEVRWDVAVTNQDGDRVATYDVLTLVACRPR